MKDKTKFNSAANNSQGGFLNEGLWKIIITAIGIAVIGLTLAIAVFLAVKGSATFYKFHHSVFEFLFSSDWNPQDTEAGGGNVGALIFICGSLITCFLALALVTPFSLSVALFMTEISPRLGKRLIQPAVEMFVGIPSIIYGWVGYTVLCKWIKTVFPDKAPTGMSVLAGSIVLAVMIFPTITTVAADAIRSVPSEYRKAAYALGSTRWQVLSSVVIPSAKQGLLTGIILGLSRAFGETLAVAFVIGRVRAFPTSILSPTYNMTAIIAGEMGDTMNGGEKNSALWTMALLLFIISMFFIIVIHRIGKGKKNEKKI